MTPARFEQRLHWLKRNNYTVLGLSDAVERLASGRIGTREVAITIDDGFHSVFALASPILESYGFTATIYVASYYVKHPNPIFRLAIQYMAWKSRHDEVDLSGLIPMLCGVIPLHGDQADAPLENFYESVEAQCDEEQRVSVAREFGRRVAVDYEELVASRRMGLMSEQELKALRSRGFDIQLHSHRHRLPNTDTAISREISDNRAVLAPLTDAPLEHFCYPSGVWHPDQWPVLAALGIRSATTCIRGLNSRATPRLALRRFLDGEEIPEDEFAAELLGVKDLLRRATRRVS
jgi:peptidoglycan/xylan/chitin deacetylase (PgdA/CDA1 family)